MATPWDDFWPKLWLSVIDKAALGIAAAFVGFWLQKRLEVFKRDQALASELAKARIAAYHRAFSSLSAFEMAGGMIWVTVLGHGPEQSAEEREAALKAMKERFNKAGVALLDMMATERYLLGDSFLKAAARFTEKVHADVREAQGSTPPDEAAQARQKEERRRLRDAMALCLPPFARAPVEDLQFSAPDFDTIYSSVPSRDPQPPKK